MSERPAASEAPTGGHPDLAIPALRTHLLRQRLSLSKASVITASLQIVARLADDPLVVQAARRGPIGLYWPIRGEPDMRPPATFNAPHGLTLPGHPGASPRMLRWKPGAAMASAWATLHYPADGSAEVAPGDHGLILVPGVAFDRAGNRLGHGGGWYDRLLTGLGGAAVDRPLGDAPLLIGIAHEFQVVEHLEAQSWDVPMALIATPSELIRAGASRS